MPLSCARVELGHCCHVGLPVLLMYDVPEIVMISRVILYARPCASLGALLDVFTDYPSPHKVVALRAVCWGFAVFMV